MVKDNTTRIGINMTAADLKIIRKLKAAMQAEHGKLSVTAVIRIALRVLASMPR
jgi:hypothetical protein